MFATRLAIALIQGLLLFGVFALYDKGHGSVTDPQVIAPAAAIFFFVPLIVITGLNNIRPRLLASWAAGATIVLGIVAVHAVARGASAWDIDENMTALDSHNMIPIVFTTGLALFVAHSLIAAASAYGKRIAAYTSYFDAAWKLAVQAALSAAFTGVFWLLLTLGSGLFDIIGLKFFDAVTQSAWFAIPVSMLVLASAIHVTDVRPAIIHGVRTLKLTLFAWLLPVMTVITGMFLISLAVTGLTPIWRTHHAAGLFLTAAMVLIYTLNAAYQDGADEQTRSALLKRTGQIAALLLIPLIGLALYGTVIRIRADGLTRPDIHACQPDHRDAACARLFPGRVRSARLDETVGDDQCLWRLPGPWLLSAAVHAARRSGADFGS